MEDLCQEIALCKLHTPPTILNQLLGANLQGAVILMEMTQRSPFQEGRVGSPKTTISSSSSSMTRWRMGSSGTTSSTPKACSSKSRCGCLINTLALGLHLGSPRINTFSGKAMPGKTEVSLEQWYHEVQYIKDHYLESVVWESIV